MLYDTYVLQRPIDCFNPGDQGYSKRMFMFCFTMTFAYYFTLRTHQQAPVTEKHIKLDGII